MAVINFPDSPSNGATHTVGGITYTYNSTKGYWTATAASTGGGGGGAVPVYLNFAALPTTGNTEGDLAYLTSLQRLVAWDGTGWAGTALVNEAPTAITGLSASYSLNAGDPAEVITLGSTDLEGASLTWSYAVTSGALGNATVSQSGNVFTVTPTANSSGTFEITFTASDGVSSTTASASFTIANQSPSAITGLNSSYALASDGTATVITLSSTDPEGATLTWSHAVTTGTLGSTATITQSGNIFTITPSTNSADAGTFGVTFTASDGVNDVTATASFSLVFLADEWLVQAGWNSGSSGLYGYDHSVVVDSNDNIYVGSTFSTSSPSYRPVIHKFNNEGVHQWSKEYTFSTSIPFELGEMVIDGNDNIYIAATLLDTQNYPLIMKLNTSGAVQWARKVTGSGGTARVFYGYNLAVSPNGSDIYLGGKVVNYTGTGSLGSNYSIYMTKWNSSGSLQWSKVMANSNDRIAPASVADNNKVYFVCHDSVSTYQGAIYAINSNGTLAWRRGIIENKMQPRGIWIESSGSIGVAFAQDDYWNNDIYEKWGLTWEYVMPNGNVSGGTARSVYSASSPSSIWDELYVNEDAGGQIVSTGNKTYIPITYRYHNGSNVQRASGYIDLTESTQAYTYNKNFILPATSAAGSLFSAGSAITSTGKLILLLSTGFGTHTSGKNDIIIMSLDPSTSYNGTSSLGVGNNLKLDNPSTSSYSLNSTSATRSMYVDSPSFNTATFNTTNITMTATDISSSIQYHKDTL